MPILRGMDSETADLIYLDPPFNSGKQWENPVEAGGRKALASFKDTWELSDSHPDEEYALGQQYPATLPLIDSLYAINGGSWKAYLIYMGVRMAEMRRILKPTGSIYYHCDPVMSHGVKLLMDAIFGKGAFRNEIVWCYTTPTTPSIKRFPNHSDHIFWYAKGNKWRFNKNDVRVPYKGAGPHGGNAWLKDGQSLSEWRAERARKGKIPSNWWSDVPKAVYSKEKTGYPTQKPLALLGRIIKASSNKGELVLDPFCGCATTCHAAETLGRQYRACARRSGRGREFAIALPQLQHDKGRQGNGLFAPPHFGAPHPRVDSRVARKMAQRKGMTPSAIKPPRRRGWRLWGCRFFPKSRLGSAPNATQSGR